VLGLAIWNQNANTISTIHTRDTIATSTPFSSSYDYSLVDFFDLTLPSGEGTSVFQIRIAVSRSYLHAKNSAHSNQVP